MELPAEGLLLRPWAPGDEEALVRHANSYKIWLNVRDRFPHPYTREHADSWIKVVADQGHPPLNFAIVVEGEPVGGIGLAPKTDVHRKTAEIGYWIGREHWGQGLATAAVRRITEYAFETFDLERLEALVFEWNPASFRVLEKAGYTQECRMRKSIYKAGRLGDGMIYAKLRRPG